MEKRKEREENRRGGEKEGGKGRLEEEVMTSEGEVERE